MMFTQHHVFCNTKIFDHAIAHAFFRNVGKHTVCQIAGCKAGYILAFEQDTPARDLTQTRNGFSQLALSVSRHARNAQDFTRTKLQADPAQPWSAAIAFTGDTLELQAAFAAFRLTPVWGKPHFASNHPVGKRLLVNLRGRACADLTSITQNGNAIADLDHLVQLMRDEDQGVAVVDHLPHNDK